MHAGYDVIIYFQLEVIEENSRKFRLRRLRVELLENGSSYAHQILRAYRGQAAPQNCRK